MNRFLSAVALSLFVTTLAVAQEPDHTSGGGAAPTQAPIAPPSADTARPGDPDPDEFVPDAIEPTLDYADLQRRVVYPEEAKRNGLEGMVVLRVLISEDGTPIRYRVEHSDSPLFTDATVTAIMATKFTPATQAGKAIRLWVSIPVKYALGD